MSRNMARWVRSPESAIPRLTSTKDVFELQADSIKPGSNVVIVDDLIATGALLVPTLKPVLTTFPGGSASAAGQLVNKAEGNTLEYLFIIGLPFLKGTEKLNAPAYIMIEAED